MLWYTVISLQLPLGPKVEISLNEARESWAEIKRSRLYTVKLTPQILKMVAKRGNKYIID